MHLNKKKQAFFDKTTKNRFTQNKIQIQHWAKLFLAIF